MDLVGEKEDTWDKARVWRNPLHQCCGIINTARSQGADKYPYEDIAGAAKCVISTSDNREWKKKNIGIACNLFVSLREKKRVHLAKSFFFFQRHDDYFPLQLPGKGNMPY